MKRRTAYFLLAAIISITLLSLTRYVGWNILLELSSHFQRQYLIISFFLLGLLTLTRQRKPILVGLFCVAIILMPIFSWYIPQPQMADMTSGKLRVLSSNVSPGNKSYAKVLSFVREENPDLALFMEVTDEGVKQLQSLTDILPYSTITTEGASDLDIVVFSRKPLQNVSINFFGTDETNEFKRASILGNLIVNEQTISLIATHPTPPIRPAIFHSRNQQLERVAQYAQQLKNPVLLLGDLNITMWSPYYQRLVSKTGLRNGRQGKGILPTWATKLKSFQVPSALFWLIGIPIDHCLVSPGINVTNIRTGPNVGSDHLPLTVDLAISAGHNFRNSYEQKS